MKKLFKISILFILSAFLFGCGSKENKTVLNAAFYPAYDHLTDIRLSRLLLQMSGLPSLYHRSFIKRMKIEPPLASGTPQTKSCWRLSLVSNDRYIIWDCNDGIIIFMFNL